MRSWEKIDIVDILIEHHKELLAASIELGYGGDQEGWRQLDDKCLAIENYLETEHKLEWTGTKFNKETLA